MMAHLHRAYYVALLSAARIQRASHQAPQVFQMMSAGAAPRDRDLGRVRLRCTSDDTARVRDQIATGRARNGWVPSAWHHFPRGSRIAGVWCVVGVV
jgi:AbiEi antitoxin C-terminal domain